MNRSQKKPADARKNVPFFARFLEKQQLQDVAGGIPAQTTKFPSDNDEASPD